jgi:outer membrane murein-binding lipoprotein Lpp
MYGVIALAAILVLAGCQDTSKMSDLEKRVGSLEESIRHLEADRTKATDEESLKRARLEGCVADANADFDSNMIHNGTKQRNGSYNVPVPALEQMQRQKQSKIEECRLLYSR